MSKGHGILLFGGIKRCGIACRGESERIINHRLETRGCTCIPTTLLKFCINASVKLFKILNIHTGRATSLVCAPTVFILEVIFNNQIVLLN